MVGRLESLQDIQYSELDLDMRRDVQDIFRATPTQKQVMMFSATLSQEIRPICKKFMQNPLEIYVDDETKLTLHGLQQYYIKLTEGEKNRRLNDLLDTLEFNQVIIFVKSTLRATELDKLLRECNFPSIAVHSGVSQEERYVHRPYQGPIIHLTYPVSNDTRNSRNSTSVSVLLPTSLAEESTLNASISLSIMIYQAMLIHTFIGLGVLADLAPRVLVSHSSAAILIRMY